MIKKLLYTAPESELLFVKFEENILSAKFSTKGTETMSVEEEEDF